MVEDKETELDTLLQNITEKGEDNDRCLALDLDEAPHREVRLVARSESIRLMAMERGRERKTNSEPNCGEEAGGHSDAVIGTDGGARKAFRRRSEEYWATGRS